MSTKMIVLMSSDGKTFEVEQTVAEQSQTIKQMIKDEYANTSIPLPNVKSKTLAKVVEYCKRHVADATMLSDAEQSAELKNFDAEFMKVNKDALFDLILAAKSLDIGSLLNLTCQTVADTIKHKTPEEICKTFNIKIDLKPGEEENTSQEYAWAFE